MHASLVVDIRGSSGISRELPYFFPSPTWRLMVLQGFEAIWCSFLTAHDLTRGIFAYTIIGKRSADERQRLNRCDRP
jgi:hypothetical protein